MFEIEVLTCVGYWWILVGWWGLVGIFYEYVYKRILRFDFFRGGIVRLLERGSFGMILVVLWNY